MLGRFGALWSKESQNRRWDLGVGRSALCRFFAVSAFPWLGAFGRRPLLEGVLQRRLLVPGRWWLFPSCHFEDGLFNRGKAIEASVDSSSVNGYRTCCTSRFYYHELGNFSCLLYLLENMTIKEICHCLIFLLPANVTELKYNCWSGSKMFPIWERGCVPCHAHCDSASACLRAPWRGVCVTATSGSAWCWGLRPPR